MGPIRWSSERSFRPVFLGSLPPSPLRVLRRTSRPEKLTERGTNTRILRDFSKASAVSMLPENCLSVPGGMMRAAGRTVRGSRRNVNDIKDANGALPLSREHYPELEGRLRYKFRNIEWLERALTHRSVHSGGATGDYERLEFLGDAVLDLAVAHLLLERHPQMREGDLSKMRAALVNTSSLAEIARSLDIGPFIRLSRGELASNGSSRSSILADVFEAIFGAIYREAGYSAALECATIFFSERVQNVTPIDPKTELQEKLHALSRGAPEYILEGVEGPEHAPTFLSSVRISGSIMGRGSGATKKASQQQAAAEALALLNSEAVVVSETFDADTGTEEERET